MDFGREKGVFPLVLIQVKSAAKRTVFGLKNKREKASLPFKTQLFHIQVVRYAASANNHVQLIDYQYVTQRAIGSKRRNDPISIILIINTLNTQE